MRKITDKDRLERLNATMSQSAQPSYDGQQQQQQQQEQQPQGQESLLDNIANSAPINAIMGAGDSLRNLLSAGYLSNSESSNFGTKQGSESGEGRSYQGGRIGGDIAGFIGGGEVLDAARAAMAAKNIPMISELAGALGGNGISGIARRAIGSAGAGAAENPEDRLGGAARGAGYSLAAEAIPGIVKGGGKIAEHIVPQKYTDKLLGEAKKIYDWHSNRVTQLMRPIRDKFGNYRLYIANQNRNFLNLSQNIVEQFSPELQQSYEDVIKNPNKLSFAKAHDLQKEIGEEIGKIRTDLPSAERRRQLDAHMTAYNSLKDDMSSFLGQRNPKLAEQWKSGSDIHRDQVIPFRADEYLKKALEKGKIKYSPEEYQKTLQKLYEDEKIPTGHYLEDALNKINKKLQGSSLKKTGLGYLVTGASTAVGGPFAGLMAHTLHPEKMISNPAFQEYLSKAEPWYRHGVKGLIASNLQRNK